MSDSTENLSTILPAYSGQVIGAVVNALDYDHEVLSSRTARRFFAGEPVSQHDHTEILLALGEALVSSGVVPNPPLFQQYDASISRMLPAAVARAAVRWDRLVGMMKSHSGTVDDPSPARVRMLRLVVVELALRAFAFIRLSGLEPSPPETPLWAQENGGGKFLRAIIGKAGLTRNRLAVDLGVSNTTVDNWLDGKNRPAPKNITAIAETLAGQPGNGEASQIEQIIRRQFTFATLADLLAEQIGREQVIELCTALVRFIWLITEDVNGMNLQPIAEACGEECDAMEFGTACPSTHVLLRNLAIVETDHEWQRDIIAATMDWGLTFQLAGVQNVQPRVAAGLAQDFLDVSDLPDPAQEALAQFFAKYDQLDYQRISRLDLSLLTDMWETQPAHLQAIARDFPASPTAHSQLGSILGKIGEITGQRDLVDEGITECKVASALLPNWDNPAVEPGIILANIRAFDEVLVELQRAAERLPQPTPHLQYATGYVLMNLSRPAEALEQLESVIAVRPDYTLAFRDAARCAFMLDDKRKGIRYAKTAKRLGDSYEYNAWRKRRKK